MVVVHLVRHGAHAELGHVLSGRSDIPLDERGHAQAGALADSAGPGLLASIHSSPRRRALQTAAPLGRALRLPVHTADALDEVDFGAFTGRPFASLEHDPEWQRWNHARAKARCPGGETMAEVVARATAFLFSLDEAQSPAACFTHCDVIRSVVAHLLGMPTSHLFMLDCDPASVTTLVLHPGEVHLSGLNRRILR